MSEISTIEAGSSIPTEGADLDNVVTRLQATELILEAKQAIHAQAFDRARQIISRLSEVYCESQSPKGLFHSFLDWALESECPVTPFDLYQLFYALCIENQDEGKKMIPVLEKSFSITVNGDHYELSAGKFTRSFTIPTKINSEDKALKNLQSESRGIKV